MNKGVILSLLFIIFLLSVQLGLLTQTFLSLVDLVLLWLLFLLLERYHRSVWWLIVITAIILDLFSPLALGAVFVIFLLVSWFVYILNRSWLTNRSLYTILFLSLLGSVFYKLGLLAITGFYHLKIDWSDFFSHLIVALGVEAVFVIILYIVSQNLNKNKYHA